MVRLKLFLIFLLSFFILTFGDACGIRKGQPPSQEPVPVPPVAQDPSPPAETPPTEPIKKEEPKKDVVLGSFDTKLVDNDKDRITNIKLAAKAIEGYIIKPGEVFSFNKVVGARTPERGYKEAKVLVDGKYGEGIGGGVCQLSTTLYNSAKKSGLEILERHSHSKKVSYVETGQDAAVNYNNLDFKFKNTKNYPIKIRARVENGRVFASIIKGS